jgi:hypothetical protein
MNQILKLLNKYLLLFILIILFTINVTANEEIIKINFIGTQERIEKGSVEYFITDLKTTEKEEGFFDLEEPYLILSEGVYIIELLINEEKTENFDYYAKKNILIYGDEETIDIFISPIGGLFISILDQKNNADKIDKVIQSILIT